MASQNTYNTFNNNSNQNIEPNNNIYYNLVKVSDTTERYSAFTLSLRKQPTKACTLNDLSYFANNEIYKTYDVAEVLRGDYSRLFFDIDCHTEEEFEDQFYKAFEVVKNIVDIIAKATGLEPENILSGYIESKSLNQNQLQDIAEKLAEDYYFVYDENAMILKTEQQKAKYISSHLYLRGVYFTRAGLKKLFRDFNSKAKQSLTTMPEILDCCVYVEGQRIFRHPYSGKAIQARGTPKLNQLSQDFLNRLPDAFVATKTENDKIFISENSKTFSDIDNYLNTFKLKINPQDILDETKSKKYFKSFDIKEDDKLYNSIKAHVATHTSHSQWYFELVKKVQYYIYKNPNTTDEELINHFSAPEFRYTTQTHKRQLLQISSIKAAIKLAKENPLEEGKIKKELVKAAPVDAQHMVKLDIFKKIVGKYKGVDILTLAELLHNTFIFFTRADDLKESIKYIAFKDNKEQIQVKSIEAFKSYLQTYPIPVRLLKNELATDQDKGLIHELKIYRLDIIQAFNILDMFKSRYYDFDLCSADEDVFDLFKPLDKPEEPVPLPEEVDKIFDLYATTEDKEDQDNITYKVDIERKKYILNWFAWLLQHPEDRNKTCLQISAKQGIGKNIITNTIAQALSNRFAFDNANIDNIIGTYNGGVDKKLLIVMNEVDNKAKNIDKLKSTITDPHIPINEKYGASYMGTNHANYVIFTNHTDTKTIAPNDRRFAFIKTNAEPLPKEFYTKIVDSRTSCLKHDIAQQFIDHLLTRDLSNYKNNEAPIFDKVMIYENRKEMRSAIYRLVDAIFENSNDENTKLVHGVLIIPDLVEQLKLYRQGTLNSICDYYGIQNKSIEKDLDSELKKEEMTPKGITKIIGFNDEDPYQITRCKKNFARDKNIIQKK